MRISTALCLSLLCICAAGADSPPPAKLACNLKAIGAAERPRYNELVKRLRSAVKERREIPTGYVFRLDSASISLPEAADWIRLERLCCPFLTLQLETSGSQADWSLTLTGPPGVKDLLRAEFRVNPH
jgi:hypothetical protein